MDEIKTTPIEPNAVSDPIGEQAQYLNTTAGKQPSCQTNVLRSWRHDPLANLPGLLQNQSSFGARLADGYAPKAEVRVPGRQRPEARGPAPRSGFRPISHSSSANKIVHPNRTTRAEIELGLAEVRKAWQKYQAAKGRGAVYIYLEAVFALVRKWQRLNCALKNSRAALRLQHDAPQLKPEPFGIVIFCTADPEVAEGKGRSKWSRVLRYAVWTKRPGQRLTDFVKINGGLNECARKFARIAG
jgi:hypothetical protein